MGNVEFLFVEEDNLVVAHASGSVRDTVFKESLNKIFNSEMLADGYKGLVDTRMVSGIEGPSSDAMFDMARNGSEKKRKVAVIYSSELIFGLVRIYDSYNQNAEMELFENLEEAVDWLEIPNSAERAVNFCKDCDSVAGLS